jgi:predicted ATPase
MPWLLRRAELEALQRKAQSATRERMVRELGEALETLTAERPLVLVLEDLHWSDYATLDWLSFLARRRETAQLLVLGTYRPVDVIVREHPLKSVKQELQMHGHCQELPLECLTEAEVTAYLRARFAGSELPAELGRVVYEHTDGNPLFTVAVVEEWVGQGLLLARGGRWELQAGLEEVVGVPESLRQMIERQLERLSLQEQQLLEAASVVGTEFSAAAVAAALAGEAVAVEGQCERLARRGQFLRPRGIGTWPDGTVAARYGFIHAFHQEVLYGRVTAGRCLRLHRMIGEREEAAYGERAGEIAAELAVHFERGQDYGRAVQYLRQAAENALRRSAHVEAITLLTKGLELLKTLPDTPERAQQELRLQVTLGVPLIAIKGYAAPEVECAYTRARELCQQMDETPQLFPILFGLLRFHAVRGEHQIAKELGEQLLRLAHSSQDTTLLLTAYEAMGGVSLYTGALVSARVYLEEGIALYHPQQHRSLTLLYGEDPGLVCRDFAAWALWLLGYPDQALEKIRDALALAEELAHSFGRALTLTFAAVLHQFRRERQAFEELAETVLVLSSEQGFAQALAEGPILHGWALVEHGQAEEGITQIHQGLAAHRAGGIQLMMPYFFALLAEAYGKVGQAEEGLTALAEALAAVDNTGQRFYEAELYRLKGELSLQLRQVKTSQDRSEARRAGSAHHNVSIREAGTVGRAHPTREDEAEECLWKAIKIARRQQAKSLELRAVVSLSRLWQKQGKGRKARKLLTEICDWFTEGFATADLQEAKALLGALAPAKAAASR